MIKKVVAFPDGENLVCRGREMVDMGSRRRIPRNTSERPQEGVEDHLPQG